MERCYNKKLPGWINYGGRGIKVHLPWHDPVVFLRDLLAEIGRRPSSKHSLDRIDNDGDYAPGNIRWATPLQQLHNRRNGKKGAHRMREKWKSQIGIKGKYYYLGTFNTKEDAQAAYAKAAQLLHGEFLCL
jgi:hypothetical protein